MRTACRAALINLATLTAEEDMGSPLSLGYLLAYARQALGRRVESRIFQYRLGTRRSMLEAALRDLAAFAPRIVGISCYGWNVEAALALARALKRRWPALLVVLGGPEIHPGRAALLRAGTADALVVGEGEETWVELLRRRLDGRAWAGTPGALAMGAQGPVSGPQRALIEPLDRVPSPWTAGDFPRDPAVWNTALLETSRGCPMDCSFCTWTNRRGKVRRLSEARVAADLEVLGRLRPKNVFVCDSDFFWDRERGLRLARLMRGIGEKSDIQWYLEVSIEHLDDGVLEATGHPCFGLGVGVESLSPRVLRLNGRNPDLRRARAALDRLRRRPGRAEVNLHLICGLPGETRESFLAGLDEILSVPSARPIVFCAQALPGSRLAGSMSSLIRRRRRPPHYVLATDELSESGLRELRRTTFELLMLMNHPQTRDLLRRLAKRRAGSITAVFTALRRTLGADARSILETAWRHCSRFPAREQFSLNWEWRPVIDAAQEARLSAGVQAAARAAGAGRPRVSA
ncbi:MAG: B12-binding domain-containing radical SAM protein [Elusimicrobia bacterium]|nr:B12-binding domain-containing radical SAM protein [Elusimicrobiota bacterium]